MEDELLRMLAAIHADPADAATRLVCADWLEERGDQRSAAMRALDPAGKRVKARAGNVVRFVGIVPEEAGRPATVSLAGSEAGPPLLQLMVAPGTHASLAWLHAPLRCPDGIFLWSDLDGDHWPGCHVYCTDGLATFLLPGPLAAFRNSLRVMFPGLRLAPETLSSPSAPPA